MLRGSRTPTSGRLAFHICFVSRGGGWGAVLQRRGVRAFFSPSPSPAPPASLNVAHPLTDYAARRSHAKRTVRRNKRPHDMGKHPYTDTTQGDLPLTSNGGRRSAHTHTHTHRHRHPPHPLSLSSLARSSERSAVGGGGGVWRSFASCLSHWWTRAFKSKVGEKRVAPASFPSSLFRSQLRYVPSSLGNCVCVCIPHRHHARPTFPTTRFV